MPTYTYKWFGLSEFACRCGCGLNKIDPDFVMLLDKIREIAGFPFVVTSGCRCAKQNQLFGGVSDSAHLVAPDGFCHAADIKITSSFESYQIDYACSSMRVLRKGLGKNFFHIDNRKDLPQMVFWDYYPRS